LILSVVASFDVNVRSDRSDEIVRPHLVEDAYGVHTPQRGQQFCSFVFGNDRASGAFQLRYGTVAVDANEKAVAAITRCLKIANVPNMEEVETPVGENDLPPKRAHLLRSSSHFIT
jgi:hypothetical protein